MFQVFHSALLKSKMGKSKTFGLLHSFWHHLIRNNSWNYSVSFILSDRQKILYYANRACLLLEVCWGVTLLRALTSSRVNYLDEVLLYNKN